MDNSEIKETMKSLSDKAQDIKAYIAAYNYCLESFKSVLGGYIKTGETMEKEIRQGCESEDLRKFIELNSKTKLMREVICFMETTLESAKKGEIK